MKINSSELAKRLVYEVLSDLNEAEKTMAVWALLTLEERAAQGDIWIDKFDIIIKNTISKSRKNYQAFFDGSATPNPGHMKIGGYVVDSSRLIFKYSKDLGYGTNNEAEYLSLIYLLEKLIENQVSSITIYGDSKLVVNQVNGKWKANKKMSPYRDKALYLIKKLDRWKLLHIPREQNKVADSLT